VASNNTAERTAPRIASKGIGLIGVATRTSRRSVGFDRGLVPQDVRRVGIGHAAEFRRDACDRPVLADAVTGAHLSQLGAEPAMISP
jgi:hypothetical protein